MTNKQKRRLRTLVEVFETFQENFSLHSLSMLLDSLQFRRDLLRQNYDGVRKTVFADYDGYELEFESYFRESQGYKMHLALSRDTATDPLFFFDILDMVRIYESVYAGKKAVLAVESEVLAKLNGLNAKVGESDG